MLARLPTIWDMQELVHRCLCWPPLSGCDLLELPSFPVLKGSFKAIHSRNSGFLLIHVKHELLTHLMSLTDNSALLITRTAVSPQLCTLKTGTLLRVILLIRSWHRTLFRVALISTWWVHICHKVFRRQSLSSFLAPVAFTLSLGSWLQLLGFKNFVLSSYSDHYSYKGT